MFRYLLLLKKRKTAALENALAFYAKVLIKLVRGLEGHPDTQHN
jgi:hypothetical protein